VNKPRRPQKEVSYVLIEQRASRFRAEIGDSKVSLVESKRRRIWLALHGQVIARGRE
jgi:hypothetical protein